MKKLLPLLSVLLLISCVQEDIQQPVGSDFEVLNIERNQTDILIYYNLDILYTGKVDSESLIKKVKEIHQQYSELNMTIWLSKESYKNKMDGVFDSSIDENFIVKSQSSWSKKIDYLEWTQFFGELEDLNGKRAKLVSYKTPLKEKRDSKPYDLKKDEKYGIKDIIDITVTTNYNCRLLPDPDSNQELTRIPENTELVVLESKDVQQGRLLNKWYKVYYGGYTGWTSGWNMKEEPELRVLSYEESMKNYEKKIGKKPTHNPLTGKLPIIDNWLKKNKNNYKTIKYRQWYEPYVINNQWICRVQYDEEIGGIKITSDMLFTVRGGEIINVSEK
tara:strand:- start:19951 stop:20946 length:996 start_codon:yes stop_codon:yes gene_type:complete